MSLTEEIVLTGEAPPKTFLERQLANPNKVIDYGAYAETASTPRTEDTLAMVRRLAQEQMDCERRVLDLTQQLKTAVQELESIKGGEFTKGRLPEIMEQYGLPRFEFIDGVTGGRWEITFRDKLKVALPTMQQGNKMVKDPAKCKIVFDWFRSIGLGGIIQKELTIPVGLENDEFVSALSDEIKAAHPDLDIAVSEEIHHSRLASQVSKRVEAGKEVHELIRLTPVKIADAKLK